MVSVGESRLAAKGSHLLNYTIIRHIEETHHSTIYARLKDITEINFLDIHCKMS